MSDSETPKPKIWTTTQIYVLGVICLALGLPAGYLLHAGPSGSPAAVTQADPHAGTGAPAGQPTPEQMRRMADKAAEPLLVELKSRPADPDLLSRIGNVYYDTQLYPEAIRYYAESLKYAPRNVNVRTDMATAMFFLGDADRALAELNTSLQYQPNHPQSLLNLGLIKWESRMDTDGAIAAWQKLLDTNPNFEQAGQVREMIARARQHAGIKPGTKSGKPI